MTLSQFSLSVAAVDVGSNSLLLTIVRRGGQGDLGGFGDIVVLEERCVITRLGEGLGQSGSLSEEAMDRSLAVLEEFGTASLALGSRIRAVGTSALRRAQNADAFLLRAHDALGADLEVLSGEEEARFGFLGALSGLEGVEDKSQDLVVIDPGGGSTEVIWGGGDAPRLHPRRALSLEVGAVRSTEAFLKHDPPTTGELSELRTFLKRKLAHLEPLGDGRLIAVGGTATTLGALSLGLENYDGAQVHGMCLQSLEIGELGARLSTLPLSERLQIPCLPPGRADIAVAGALILEELMVSLGAEELIISDRGLRYGLITELLDEK